MGSVGTSQWCAKAQGPEPLRLTGTIPAQEDEHPPTTTGCSNGRTAAVGFLVDTIRRIGHEFRNFDNYRLRLLLRCRVRWQAHRAAGCEATNPNLSHSAALTP